MANGYNSFYDDVQEGERPPSVASVSPGFATDTPQGASVPSPGFAGLPNFSEGLGGYSSARMTGPTQEQPRGNWADALQAFGAGLSDAGMGLQGKQGNALANLMEFQQKQQQRQAELREKLEQQKQERYRALANLMEFQQKQQQRQAELREKLEQQKQERYRQDFQDTLSLVEKLKGDPKKLKTVLEARAVGGSISAQTMRRAGFGDEDYDEAFSYMETIQQYDPKLAKQLATDPGSIPTSVLRANVDLVREIRKEQAKALAEQNIAAAIEAKRSRGESLTGADLAILGRLKKAKAEGDKAEAEASVAQQFGAEAARTDLGLKAEDLLTKRLYSQPQAAANLAQTESQNILDPRVREAKQQLAAAGASRVQQSVNTQVPLQEELQKDYAKGLMAKYDQLRDAPAQFQNIDKAIALIPKAKGFMGPLGQTKLEVAKFMKANLGMTVNTEGIKTAEELQTRIFQNVMDNLKKMDAQPSQLQQQIMMAALGNLGTDPNALVNVLRAYQDVIRDKVMLYNEQVGKLQKQGVKLPGDPVIKLPMANVPPKRVDELLKKYGVK